MQIQTGVSLWAAEGASVSAAVLIAVPVVALVAIVLAWRGSFPARLVTVAACLAPALTGLPVYFVPDVPPGAIISVSIGIFCALVVAVLLLLPGRRSAMLIGLATPRGGRCSRCVVCSRLCGVPEQIPASVPARDSDRLIKWFIGVVVIAVAVNLLSSFVVVQKWAWLPPAVFVAALLVAVPSTGLLRRERYGATRARVTALLALTGYLAVTVWGSVTGWPLALMILSLAYLWEAGVMLTWPTLRSRADFDRVALGTSCLLVGSAFLLLRIANLPDTWTLRMVAGLVVRVAFLLLGLAALLLGVSFLLDRWQLVGIPFLLFGVAAVLGGVAALLDGWTLVGVALLLGPVTALLLGVAFLLDRWVLTGVPFLLGAVAAPLSGIAALLAGWTLTGVAFLLFGVALLLGGVAALLAGWTLVGVPFLLFGVAALLGSVAALLAGWTYVGVAFVLLGVAALLGGVALLYRPELPRQLVAWLTKRGDLAHGRR